MSRNTLERMGALTRNCHLATASKTVGMAVMVALEADCDMLLVHLHYRPQAAITLQNVCTHFACTISALKPLLTISRIQLVTDDIPHLAYPHPPGP